MAQSARRSVWPSSQVEQAKKRARVLADGLVELHVCITSRTWPEVPEAGRVGHTVMWFIQPP